MPKAEPDEWVSRLQKECSSHAVIGIVDFTRTQDLGSELSTITAPSLVMAGMTAHLWVARWRSICTKGYRVPRSAGTQASAIAFSSAGLKTVLKPMSNFFGGALCSAGARRSGSDKDLIDLPNCAPSSSLVGRPSSGAASGIRK